MSLGKCGLGKIILNVVATLIRFKLSNYIIHLQFKKFNITEFGDKG